MIGNGEKKKVEHIKKDKSTIINYCYKLKGGKEKNKERGCKT